MPASERATMFGVCAVPSLLDGPVRQCCTSGSVSDRSLVRAERVSIASGVRPDASMSTHRTTDGHPAAQRVPGEQRPATRTDTPGNSRSARLAERMTVPHVAVADTILYCDFSTQVSAGA